MMTMTARVTKQGTAISESALCAPCVTPENEAQFTADDATGERVDASGNEALSCQSCGDSTAEIGT